MHFPDFYIGCLLIGKWVLIGDNLDAALVLLVVLKSKVVFSYKKT